MITAMMEFATMFPVNEMNIMSITSFACMVVHINSKAFIIIIIIIMKHTT